MSWEDGEALLPEDSTMGLLADTARPNISWTKALTVCQQAISALEQGEIPEELFLEAVRTPLSFELKQSLEGKALSVRARYGLPEREKNRINVPLRLSDGDVVVYGNIYLILVGKSWLIEQWAIDLSPLPMVNLEKSLIDEPK